MFTLIVNKYLSKWKNDTFSFVIYKKIKQFIINLLAFRLLDIFYTIFLLNSVS